MLVNNKKKLQKCVLKNIFKLGCLILTEKVLQYKNYIVNIDTMQIVTTLSKARYFTLKDGGYTRLFISLKYKQTFINMHI